MTEQSLAGVQPESRYALYYPYIHIRDENWLKGTILAFQKVRRLVPGQFTVKDQAITKRYAAVEGPAGHLLESLVVEAPEIRSTQEWLRQKISERIDELTLRYAEKRYLLNFWAASGIEMLLALFDQKLLTLLLTQKLAWYSREPGEPDSFNWVTMHPKVGAAMMSVLALAAARIKGLSVVTPSADAHLNSSLANQEQAVFEAGGDSTSCRNGRGKRCHR